MGYTTEFRGSFQLDKELDPQTIQILHGLNRTRRMKRNVGPEYGVEGEFYFKEDDNFGQTKEDNIIDYNKPPSTQPGLWCQWQYDEEYNVIEWDGREKFYNYVEWIEYIIAKVLAPKGYSLTGTVEWRGEDWDDTGRIEIIDNKITVYS